MRFLFKWLKSEKPHRWFAWRPVFAYAYRGTENERDGARGFVWLEWVKRWGSYDSWLYEVIEEET